MSRNLENQKKRKVWGPSQVSGQAAVGETVAATIVEFAKVTCLKKGRDYLNGKLSVEVLSASREAFDGLPD